MSTVQRQLHKLALIISPTTKKGFKFNDSTAALTISGATNASPIVITTTTNHGLVTGQQVFVASVGGNTAANSTASNPNWSITRVSATTFSLDGSTGNGVYTSGGTATAELVGTVDTASITRQRLMDIYNQARMVLFNNIYKSVDGDEISKYVYGSFITASIAIGSYSAPYKLIAKPSGFIRLVGMVDGNATPLPIIVLPNNLLQEAKRGTSSYYTVSSSNLIAFEVKSSGVDYWAIPGNAGTSPASVDYYGITDWSIFTDVTGGTSAEVFSLDVEYMIIEIAQAIYEEQGSDELNSLALRLLGKAQ